MHRYGLPLSVVLIDLDRFKVVNDEHGHDTGDRPQSTGSCTTPTSWSPTATDSYRFAQACDGKRVTPLT